MQNKLDFFKDVNFEPLFFLKNGAEFTTYLEFKEFIETTDFKEYFTHKFELDHEDHLITPNFLKLAYTYCVFFNSWYLEHEMFLKNKKWIMDKMEDAHGYRDFEDIYKLNEEHDLSKKWFDIIEQFNQEENDHKKVLLLATLKYSFVHEYISFVTKWLPEQIEKNFFPKIVNISLV